MKYNKLVRDRIPEIIAESGKEVTFRILNDDEYKIELEKKLVEEVAEFRESKSVEEIADIYQVILHLCCAYGISIDDMSRAVGEKAAKRGCFYRRIFLEEVEDD